MTEDDLKKLRETQSLGCGRDCSGAADEVVDKLIAEVRRLRADNKVLETGAAYERQEVDRVKRERDEARAELHEWRTARTHGVCEEERLAEVARRVDAERERDEARTTLTRVAEAMACKPADDDDLVEAVRLLVRERDEARGER